MPFVVLDELVSSLHDLVLDAKPAPFSADKYAIRKKDLIYLVEEIMRSMPSEVAQARSIVESRDAYITEAQQEAKNIVDRAKEQAEKMVAKEKIVQEAETLAKEIVKNAKTKSTKIRVEVSEYCHKALFEAEQELAHVVEDLKVTRANFNRGKE